MIAFVPSTGLEFPTGRMAGSPAAGVPTPAPETPADISRPLAPLPTPEHETERLGDEIACLAAHIGAATHRLLVLIREFDEREGWACGFRSCAAWLSWRTGIAPGPAREKVRVATALAALPGISEAMARGELSYSKVRALTRVATPENEAELSELARHATAAHTEKLVRAWRRVDRLEEAESERKRHQNRYVRLHPDEDGSWVLRGRLDPEVGALLQKALEWAGETLYQEAADPSLENGPEAHTRTKPDTPTEAVTTTAGQRRADAIGLLAERALAGAGVDEEAPQGPEQPARSRPLGRAERFQVVLHVDAQTMVAGSEAGSGVLAGPAVLAESGIGVPAGTSRRLSCDAGVVEMHHGRQGKALDVGRRRRTVPPAIRRALDHRDGSCRFPGCECRYTDAHHITHWADGGETKLDNLILLCHRHHRAVHEEGFQVELAAGGGAGLREVGHQASECIPGPERPNGGDGRVLTARFYRPDGRLIPTVPDPPIVPSDPAAALAQAHLREGIEPGPWTPTPRWNGEGFDLSLALDMLWQALARERQAQSLAGQGSVGTQGGRHRNDREVAEGSDSEARSNFPSDIRESFLRGPTTGSEADEGYFGLHQGEAGGDEGAGGADGPFHLRRRSTLQHGPKNRRGIQVEGPGIAHSRSSLPCGPPLVSIS